MIKPWSITLPNYAHLKFFLLDVSLSFVTGCKTVVLFARDRPKKNYVLPSENPLSEILLHPLRFSRRVKSDRRTIGVGHVPFYYLKIPNLKTLGKAQLVHFPRKHSQLNSISNCERHGSWACPGFAHAVSWEVLSRTRHI